jgi:hypothetical protein
MQDNFEIVGVEILQDVYVLAQQFVLSTEAYYNLKIGPAYSGHSWQYWCSLCRAIYPSNKFCERWVRNIPGLHFKRRISVKAIEQINIDLAKAHPDYAQFLYVDYSDIVPGELGLFTKVALGRSSDRELLLGQYEGEIVSKEIAENPLHPSDYRMPCGPYFLDAIHYLSTYLRYANDDLWRSNIYIDQNTYRGNKKVIGQVITLYVRVYKSQDISCNSEITLSYGRKYWLDFLRYPDLLPTDLVTRVRQRYGI